MWSQARGSRVRRQWPVVRDTKRQVSARAWSYPGCGGAALPPPALYGAVKTNVKSCDLRTSGRKSTHRGSHKEWLRRQAALDPHLHT